MKFPRWLSWLFVLFLAYMIYVGNQSSWRLSAEKPIGAPAPVETRSYPALEALTDGTRWRHALNPEYQPTDAPCAAPKTPEGMLPSYAIIDQPGTGTGAACGDRIALRITYWNSRGHIDHTADTKLILGEQKSLDALLVGIAPAERRTIFLRPTESYKTLPGLKKDVQQILTVERIASAAAQESKAQ
jgi:hypothetical protein